MCLYAAMLEFIFTGSKRPSMTDDQLHKDVLFLSQSVRNLMAFKDP